MEPDILATPGQHTRQPDWTPNGTTPESRATAHLSAAAPAQITPVTTSPPRHDHMSNGTALHANGRAAIASEWPIHGVHAHAVLEPHAIKLSREETPYMRFGKRMIDVLGALIALIFALPLMTVLAVLIKIESRGPVFYRSMRVGRGGRLFAFYKLRSMVDGAHDRRHHVAHLNECDGPVFKISNDPRVTRIGRLLRRTSLDEIPQFFNVLRGEMSLVGPRPPISEEVQRYEPWQLRRLSVRPGLTCLWQISGRSRIGFEEWMRLDLEYIRRMSPWMDLKILLRTIPAVLSRDGAY